MKPLTLLLALGMALSGLQAQKNQGRKVPLYALKVGTSFTYIWNESEDKEYTWRLNAAWQFSSRFSAGVNLMNIWNESPLRDQQLIHAVVAGPFGQFKLTDSRVWDLYAETGIFVGNYCSCLDLYEVPYKRNGLVYWANAIGVNVRINRFIQLDMALADHIIFNRVPKKYNFTQYIIGLDFLLLKN